MRKRGGSYELQEDGDAVRAKGAAFVSVARILADNGLLRSCLATLCG